MDRDSLGAGSWDVEGGERTLIRGDLGLPQNNRNISFVLRQPRSVVQRGPPWSSVSRMVSAVAALFLIFFSHRYQSLQNDSPEASFETVGVVRAGGTATKLTV